METSTSTDRRAYMKGYMKKRYNENLERERAYKRTNNLKKKDIEITEQDEQEFGVYLADIIKLRRMLQTIPQELVVKVFPLQTQV